MFQQFYELFQALNHKALEKVDEDLSLIEAAQTELIDAWTDYMMSCENAPSSEELHMYEVCCRIVERF